MLYVLTVIKVIPHSNLMINSKGIQWLVGSASTLVFREELAISEVAYDKAYYICRCLLGQVHTHTYIHTHTHTLHNACK